MKNLFTLFLSIITALGFAQEAHLMNQPATGPFKHFTLAPNTPRPYEIHSRPSALRSSGSCDTTDWLDYNTYNEINTQSQGISYIGGLNSSGSQPIVTEITSSQIHLFNAAYPPKYTYLIGAYDSLAFCNFATTSQYSKALSTSQVTIDSFGLFMGISGDTAYADTLMANDSLVFKFYSIPGTGLIPATPDTSVTFSGYGGLAPFFTGADHITYAQFPIHHAFTPGHGFAVRVDYYNADTSSHCNVCFGFADSCGSAPGGGDYPAALSPFANRAGWPPTNPVAGNSFFGEIDSNSARTAAVVNDYCNTYSYVGTGYPTSCNWVYWQNWQFLANVTVTNTLGLTVNGSASINLPCTGNPTQLVTTTTGDNAGATYAWSSNVFGSASAPKTTIYNPGTYDVTVTNSQGCQATAEVVAQYASGINVTPSFTFPTEICMGQAAQFTNTSSDLTGYTSLWHFAQGPDSITAAPNPSHTYTNQGVYTVTLVLDSAGCTFGTNQTVQVLNCVGIQNVTLDNNVSIIPNPSNGNVSIIINDADKNVTLTVYNIIGQAVKTYATTESPSVFSQQLDLTNMTNGTYLLKIQSGTKTATKKLVITK